MPISSWLFLLCCARHVDAWCASGVTDVTTASGVVLQGVYRENAEGACWLLVLAYSHAGGTNPTLVPDALPTSPTDGFSHMGIVMGSIKGLWSLICAMDSKGGSSQQELKGLKNFKGKGSCLLWPCQFIQGQAGGGEEHDEGARRDDGKEPQGQHHGGYCGLAG